ncbi:hypothetical protein N9R81_06420 [Flavobacteriales bacterium]|nr:hypothetical protein [Flavobacteriales bacterium]
MNGNGIICMGLIGLLCSCTKPNPPVFPVLIGPSKFLPTLTFDGTDLFDGGETCFPTKYNFNTTQDANNNGIVDVEDNLENHIRFAIGDNISGTGRTGLANRGPNNQRPIVYFHFVETDDYDVYQYWLYYADNDWINDHEHDWEKYFVYVVDSVPEYIKISHHDEFTTYSWDELTLDDGHPSIGVDGGSHAMGISAQDGVKIRYSGAVSANNGNLIAGDGQTFTWQILTNDNNVIGGIPYTAQPHLFYYGDPFYSTNSTEFGDDRQAPWMRTEWSNPPTP